jgi:hypothetical protein
MPKEGGEVHQSADRIDAFAIPAKQRGHGKRMAQVM